MTLTIALICAAALLALGVLAIIIGRTAAASRVIYGAIVVVATVSLVVALAHFLGVADPESLTLPVGLPWLGAHFRLDPLSTFFLIVVDLGAATASIFALGYGSHEPAPGRILPFFASTCLPLRILPICWPRRWMSTIMLASSPPKTARYCSGRMPGGCSTASWHRDAQAA